MNTLSTLLARFEIQDPLIDATGLSGMFYVNLQWSPDIARSPKPGIVPAGVTEPTGPSLFTALEQQLGLKLESHKGPVEIIVIDSAEKIPTEN